MAARSAVDVAVVGGGHNGLVTAAMLAAGGHSVVVLERSTRLGGAAVSTTPFAEVGARLSRYAYLVSLFPADLLHALGLAVQIRPRRVASYTPVDRTGLLVTQDDDSTRESLRALTGANAEFSAWQRFHAMCRHVAGRVFPTLTEPLRSAAELRRLIGDEQAWSALFEEPLAAVLERTFSSDVVRGLVLTDGLIGTFASADDPRLLQNRCFLLHVIGNGTGRWEVPVGGMGALTEALADCARRAGAELRTSVEVVKISPDERSVSIECDDGTHVDARHVVASVAPRVLADLLGEQPAGAPPEGSQLKVNLLLRRLPRLRDRSVTAEQAFAGTFHCNEGFAQLESAFAQAQHGQIPEPVPCEVYCHTLTDPSILEPELRAAGAHTMTVFALHMPARLFTADPAGAKQAALTATLRSMDSVLAEPLEDCLWRAGAGSPCIEALTPPELEAELGMPGGHIFHRDLSWPYAEADEEIGRWGVETAYPNVWLGGAGARRGGGVSGIPGHNAARAVLAALS